MAKKIFYHVYVSSATDQFSKDNLIGLLEQSRKNNSRDGITGILLFKDGNFLQIVEGSEKSVKSLLARIQQDTRHHGIIKLLEGEKDERQFGEWSMGFRDLNSPEVKELEGFSEFLNIPLTGKEFLGKPNQCERLLLSFKKNIR